MKMMKMKKMKGSLSPAAVSTASVRVGRPYVATSYY